MDLSLKDPSADTPLLRATNNGVATVTLNRPKQYNALSDALLDALSAELAAIAKDSAVRVVVIAGNGAAFCAGHDLKEMQSDRDEQRIAALFTKCAAMMQAITRLPQPVIARVHGIATAAGCQLVAQCDLAVASENAKFATSGINVGLFCSTPAVPLSRNVARKKAFEMLVTGDFIDAPSALAQGLVNRVVALDQLDAAVQSLADSIKSKPADSIALGKRLFYEQAEMSLASAYDKAASVMACNFMDANTNEGVSAFMEKRKPNWS